MLEVGDRVRWPGFAWKDEPNRFGRVTEVYRGLGSVVYPGVEMVAVEFDDGKVERGFLRQGGGLMKCLSLGGLGL